MTTCCVISMTVSKADEELGGRMPSPLMVYIDEELVEELLEELAE
jgi:hypothetical protein